MSAEWGAAERILRRRIVISGCNEVFVDVARQQIR